VTAGVLRGERARFQLFGDTVNTAARMESNGKKNRIQISKETADLLDDVGKSFWFSPREEKIQVKGKGELQTFWLQIRGGGGLQALTASSHSTGRTLSDTNITEQCADDGSFAEGSENLKAEELRSSIDQRIERLVNWNVDVLVTLLKQIERFRRSANIVPDSREELQHLEELMKATYLNSTNSIDEVVEVVALGQFEAARQQCLDPVEISPEALKQLRSYVTMIAHMYNENSFHSFEHAR
jgi:hypothetical protein